MNDYEHLRSLRKSISNVMTELMALRSFWEQRSDCYLSNARNSLDDASQAIGNYLEDHRPRLSIPTPDPLPAQPQFSTLGNGPSQSEGGLLTREDARLWLAALMAQELLKKEDSHAQDLALRAVALADAILDELAANPRP